MYVYRSMHFILFFGGISMRKSISFGPETVPRNRLERALQPRWLASSAICIYNSTSYPTQPHSVFSILLLHS